MELRRTEHTDELDVGVCGALERLSEPEGRGCLKLGALMDVNHMQEHSQESAPSGPFFLVSMQIPHLK